MDQSLLNNMPCRLRKKCFLLRDMIRDVRYPAGRLIYRPSLLGRSCACSLRPKPSSRIRLICQSPVVTRPRAPFVSRASAGPRASHQMTRFVSVHLATACFRGCALPTNFAFEGESAGGERLAGWGGAEVAEMDT